MSSIRRTLLASSPAAMLLALAMAALTAPVLMFSHAVAAPPDPTPPACTVANANGCTELSPIPPEDTAAVPPNFVLMLDDSGSMNWDFMPDWDYLGTNQPSGWNANITGGFSGNVTNPGVRNANVNSLYYSPTYNLTPDAGPSGYTPPPKVDGTSYGNSPSLDKAYKDGFLDRTHYQNVTTYASPGDGPHAFNYYTNLRTGYTNYGPPVVQCPAGWTLGGDGLCHSNMDPDPVAQVEVWKCPAGYTGPSSYGGNPHMCRQRVWVEGSPVDTWVPATSVWQCPSGYKLNVGDGLCYPNIPAPKPPTSSCTTGSLYEGNCVTWQQKAFFTYITGKTPATYAVHFVGTGTTCDSIYDSTEKSKCISEDEDSGTVAGTAVPTGIKVGQNIANWYSYYRTRMLMTKTGLMMAFDRIDAKKHPFRFGFGSINANGVANIPTSPTPYGFDDSMASGTGGSASNKLAMVQSFGDGSSGSQKANFWKWLDAETAAGETPLRKALDAVGQYYLTDQPWSSMPGDPGYTSSDTQFACRASFTLLTTDGFWNGDDPTRTGLAGAANADGPPHAVPSGDDVTQYLKRAPFLGGAAASGPSLADIATYYWANDLSGMDNLVPTSRADPAAWQHMTTYTIGMGFTPTGIAPSGTTVPQILGWAHAVDAGTSPTPITGFGWPTPASNSLYNIADLAHAAVNGHGDFFNVTDTNGLAEAIDKTLNDISARTIPPTPASVNASVLSLGAVSFSTGYSTKDWSGSLWGVTLNPDGTVNQVLWKADGLLDGDFHSTTSYSGRKVYTSAYDPSKPTPFSAFQFTAANRASLDASQATALGGDPTCPTGSTDTLCNRMNYLLGDSTHDGTLYRSRTSLLGAIIRSQPLYVAGATGTYYNRWPKFGVVDPPENATGVQTYDQFVTQEIDRAGTVYIGANDGMLHAFDAPVPTGCSYSGSPLVQTCADASGSAGHERWAFIPRAVYANLGNLTNNSNFAFLPTVDAAPVRRDVFFSLGGAGNNKWHTLLVGGVGLGGRGVYALDITDPTKWDSGYPMSKYPASGVLWEFDADMKAAGDCFASYGDCRPSDLGFTVPQANIGRLANGRWVAVVSNGYFPDCTASDKPTGTTAACQAIAAQAPKDSFGKSYSALFVLDAETGKLIAELKTPTGLSGVTSYGLAAPVLGDYQNDQVEDVAFAGDIQGNLWRFDLSDPTVSNWKVTLVYKGGTSKDPVTGATTVQSITSMPRLFADPTTNRFMVVFGTGRFLGVGDNSDNTVQSVYGIRDVSGTTWTQLDLTRQYLHEELAPDTLPDGTPNPLAGASLRCVTGGATDTCAAPTAVNKVTGDKGGWYINLYTTTSDGTRNDAGERVVVTPGAIFASNTAVVGTLITGSESTNACSPTTAGSILALNAVTGQSAGVSSLGGGSYAGGRITNAPTSGSLPIASALGGGRAFLPGMTLAPSGASVFSVDAPIWRRRSWSEINQNQ